MIRLPTPDRLIAGPALVPAVSHRFDLLRSLMLDAEEYRLKCKAEYDAASAAAEEAAGNMRCYLREQKVT